MSVLRDIFVHDTGRLALYLLKQSRVTVGKNNIYVNIGSGISPVPGWINVDSAYYALVARWPNWLTKLVWKVSSAHTQITFDEYSTQLKANRYVYYNCENGIPFSDSSIDYMYSSHMLEHLVASKAQLVCREIFRALKPGGWIRICVPDLQVAAEEYGRGNKKHALLMLYGSPEAGYYSGHKWMYDQESLTQLLADIGFVEIIHCEYRQGNTPDLELLDNRDGETLRIEARKPTREKNQ